MERNIGDKLQFIFHRSLIGIIFWIIMSFCISYQQLLIKNIKNELLGIILYLAAFVSFLFFYNISMKKNNWRPFGNHSNTIGALIIAFIYSILYYILGFSKVTF